MAIDKVKEYFRQFGMEEKVMEFDVSSATVDLAAEAVGVEGARICKTMSFLKPDGAGAILVQMAGDGRINNRKFKDQFGFKAKMLKPEEVVYYTGHEIGGVCTFAIERDDVDVYCDVSMKRFNSVFPACGSDNSAIELTCDELEKYSGAKGWVDICKLPGEDQ